MASESSNTIEFTTSLVYPNKTLEKAGDFNKLNNDILFVLEAIKPEFVHMWNYSSSTRKLRTEFIRNVMGTVSKIETGFTEQITGISMTLDFNLGFNSLLNSLPSNVHCLLMKYRLINEFHLVLLFLMANKHIMNYEVFEKICFQYNSNKCLFYIQNQSNAEDIKGNVLEIDLISVGDKLVRKMQENNERFGQQITKYGFIGLSVLFGAIMVYKKFI